MGTRLVVRIGVDFGTINRQGLVRALRREAPILWYELEPGREVEMEDAEGNTCAGIIEAVGDHVLRVRPIWETWMDTSRTQLVYTGAPSPSTSNVAAAATTQSASARPA